MANFIVEIGSEEIPSNFLPKQEASFLKMLQDNLHEKGLAYGQLKVFSTPRRLLGIIEDVAPFQEISEEIIMGPSVAIAYDENEVPTKALTGFCQGQKAELSELEKISTSKGEYIALKRKIGGNSAAEVLAGILPSIIGSLPFPKKMRWSNHDFSYIRPLRWIMAILDDQVVNFSVGHIASNNLTQGHRVHGKGWVTVSHADQFMKLLAQSGVVADAQERKRMIREGGDELASEISGKIIWNDGLLDEVSGLVEHPVPILGTFSKDFLEVPEEILISSMEMHQKSFGVRDDSGRLLPLFLTVLNLTPPDENLVREGWEKVLRARLEDARFFWHEDLRNGFSVWQKKLEKVIFIAQLGSMAAKESRVALLSEWLAEQTGLVKPDLAKRAGSLSKADLVSGIVGEFPALQGIMGGIYARQAGEENIVATAIREQYLPSGPESPLPGTPCGAILAIADKADTLAGCFGLGRIPTGAADQDGLRRAALGIIRIMLAYSINLSTNKIFAQALQLYGEQKWKFTQQEILSRLQDFLQGRLRNWLISQGYNNFIVDAVLSKNAFSPLAAEKKVKSLQSFYEKGDAATILGLFKRMENISRQHAVEGNWQEELLEGDAERKLAEILKIELPVVDQLLEAENYSSVLEKMLLLAKPVNNFFENTMILCEDKNLSQNRLRIIRSILERFGQIADFSRLQVA